MTRAGDAIIQDDTRIEGSISNGGRIEVFGMIQGDVSTRDLVVHEGGKVIGEIRTEQLEVRGMVQGEIAVKHLLDLGETGEVIGDLRYSQLKVAPGGHLSAELRNVPPQLFGDLRLETGRGEAVALTRMDLCAVDVEDGPDKIVFTVSNARNGWLAYRDATGEPVSSFTQADIDEGRIVFVHDATHDGPEAGFEVIARDSAGATTGRARTVTVAVG
ncbi:MAG: hypothetical protein GC150_16660 [Rhizobiales bacterium]|nr:hypothetical protein [Hyphomicrobiales bacterium]